MKKKKLLSMLLVCALVLTFVPQVQQAVFSPVYGAAFNDIAGHWAQSDIERAVAQGIVLGFPDGTFLPDNPVTRAEFATMVNRALGNNATATIPFTDVPRAEWFYNDVSRAVAAAYVGGFEDNTFRPNHPISRQETAVIISRLIPSHGVSGNLNVFPDRATVADWAVTAFQKVHGKGYMGAFDDGNLHPTSSLTRAQTARIIMSIIDNENIVRTDQVVRNNNTTLSNTIFTNGVTIHSDVGNGNATIENSVVLGTLLVQGGGDNSVTVSNSRVAQATVDKASDSVRLSVRGESVIVSLTAARRATIQTQSLTGGLHGSGINNLRTLSNSEVTLLGEFINVTVDGTNAELDVSSGTVTNLTVSQNAHRSTVNVNTGATVTTAQVNAECAFTGQGIVATMNAGANGITYERRPNTVNRAGGINEPTQVSPQAAITFNPSNGATRVSRTNPRITITFSTPMTLDNGNDIRNADIVHNLIDLRRNSTNGTRVNYTATINNARTVITITPDENFTEDTSYFVSIPANRFRDANGNRNTAHNISFSTGDESGLVTFVPARNATGIARTVAPTLTFSEAVQTNTGGMIGSGFFDSSTIIFRTGTTATGGTAVPFDASWNSSNRRVTITPRNQLIDGQVYFLGIANNRIRTVDGQTVIHENITFTVGAASSHTITFNANGGTGSMATATVNAGANYTIPANTFNRPNQRFTGWNTQANGAGTAHAAGATINNVRANVTLFAQWAAATVVIGAQGGTPLTTGTAGSATYLVTTSNFPNGSHPVTLLSGPAGVTATGNINIQNNSGTLTLNTTAATPAGTHVIRVAINGASSQNFNLVVGAGTFIPVTNITGVPTTTVAGTPLALIGTVAPANATNRTIVWSVQAAGGTGATISGSTLNTTSAGTVTVRATITNGLTASSNYTQDFTVTVSAPEPQFVPVSGILNVPTTGTAGSSLSMASATINPTNATNTSIVWSIVNDGGTGATFTGNTLDTPAAGTVVIIATIANGAAQGTEFTQTFTITIPDPII